MGFTTNLELGASPCIHIHWFLIWPGCEGGPGAIAHHECWNFSCSKWGLTCVWPQVTCPVERPSAWCFKKTLFKQVRPNLDVSPHLQSSWSWLSSWSSWSSSTSSSSSWSSWSSSTSSSSSWSSWSSSTSSSSSPSSHHHHHRHHRHHHHIKFCHPVWTICCLG